MNEEVHPRTGRGQGEIGRGLFCVSLWPNQEGDFGILRARNTVGISIVLSGKQPGAVKACLPKGAGEGERPALGWLLGTIQVLLGSWTAEGLVQFSVVHSGLVDKWPPGQVAKSHWLELNALSLLICTLGPSGMCFFMMGGKNGYTKNSFSLLLVLVLADV